jgi:hypothetical protein
MRSLEFLVSAVKRDTNHCAGDFDKDKLNDIKLHILWDIHDMTVEQAWIHSVNALNGSQAWWPKKINSLVNLEKEYA